MLNLMLVRSTLRVHCSTPLDPPVAELWCEKISGLVDYHKPVITNPGGTGSPLDPPGQSSILGKIDDA